MEHRPSATPRHRTLFWAVLVIPDQLVPCCFSSVSVSRFQLLRGRPLFLFHCGFQVSAWHVVLDAGFLRLCPTQPHFLRGIHLAHLAILVRNFLPAESDVPFDGIHEGSQRRGWPQNIWRRSTETEGQEILCVWNSHRCYPVTDGDGGALLTTCVLARVTGFKAEAEDGIRQCHSVSVSVSAQDGIVALGKAHTRFALSLSSLPKTALKTVPIFVWFNTDRSRSWRVECWPLPFSTPLFIRRSMLWCSGLSTFSVTGTVGRLIWCVTDSSQSSQWNERQQRIVFTLHMTMVAFL